MIPATALPAVLQPAPKAAMPRETGLSRLPASPPTKSCQRKINFADPASVFGNAIPSSKKQTGFR
jgi:hypothetical protein